MIYMIYTMMYMIVIMIYVHIFDLHFFSQTFTIHRTAG